jgi:rod shape-determining protein MreB
VSRDLAIDLGASRTRVYAKGHGVVLDEPSVIAMDSRSKQVMEIGNASWAMVGKSPEPIVAVRPLRHGVVGDVATTERMIRLLLNRSGVSRMGRSRVLLAVSSSITKVECRALLEATRRAGASSVYVIEQPIAAAIGAGVPVHEPIGTMVVDAGGSTSESAVMSVGGMVSQDSVRFGGIDLDEAIQAYVRKEYGIAIGDRVAEDLKIAIGSAAPFEGETKAEVSGRDVDSGKPKAVVLSPEEIRRVAEEFVQQVMNSAARCLGSCPPELAQDIISEGICLVGGSALFPGLAERLSETTSVPVRVLRSPDRCIVNGAGICLESFDAFRGFYTGIG